MNFTFQCRCCFFLPFCRALCGILITRPASGSLLFELRPVLCSALGFGFQWAQKTCRVVWGHRTRTAQPFIMHCTGFACTSGPSFFHSCSDECKHMLLSHTRTRATLRKNIENKWYFWMLVRSICIFWFSITRGIGLRFGRGIPL